MADSKHEDFVNLMIDKSKKKEVTKPQNRIGTTNQESAEENLKTIQEKIQKSKNK